jgi:hypothetical protein
MKFKNPKFTHIEILSHFKLQVVEAFATMEIRSPCSHTLGVLRFGVLGWGA